MESVIPLQAPFSNRAIASITLSPAKLSPGFADRTDSFVVLEIQTKPFDECAARKASPDVRHTLPVSSNSASRSAARAFDKASAQKTLSQTRCIGAIFRNTRREINE